METRSALVYIPGRPFELRALLPCRDLATMAGALLAKGHATCIHDYGTVSVAARMYPGDYPEDIAGPAERQGGTQWRTRRLCRAFLTKQSQHCQEIAEGLAATPPLDFVVFRIDQAADVGPSVEVANHLRQHRPAMRLVAAGRFSALYSTYLLRETEVFDCACLGDAEHALVAWANRIDEAGQWSQVPNLCYRLNGVVRKTRRQAVADLSNGPRPQYAPSVYPALRKSGEKLRLFEIEDSRGCTCVSDPFYAPNTGGHVFLKPPEEVLSEISDLRALYGARAFHLCGTGSPTSHLAALSHALRKHTTDLMYTRSASVAFLSATIASLLRDSGCAGLALQIDSGSQRLLEDHYGHEIGVSQIERVMAACREVGLQTLARLTFPIPEDDYHTRAETLRLMERTKPDATAISAPCVVPGSVWYAEANEFGFQLDARRLLWQAARETGPLSSGASDDIGLPMKIGTRSRRQVARDRQDLLDAMEELGLTTCSSTEIAMTNASLEEAAIEDQPASRLQRHLLTGDTQAAIRIVKDINAVTCQPRRLVRLRPYHTLRIAVGN